MAGISVYNGLSVFQGVDDSPVDGVTNKPISSNWAFDHAANFGLHTKVVRKTVTETVTNSNVLQNDDALLLALAANEVWHVKIVLLIDSNTTADFQYQITVPSGATCIGFHIYRNAADVFTAGSTAAASVVTWTGGGAGTTVSTGLIEGIVVCGATAGNLQLQWAQSTQNASDTKVLLNSCLIATKIA